MKAVPPTIVLLFATVVALVGPPAAAGEPQDGAIVVEPFEKPAGEPPGQPIEVGEPLSEAHARWLAEVEPLVTAPERALYRSLLREYQRDAFIEQFWKVRDPYPRTARNELKERWPLRLAEARAHYVSLTDDRSRVLLVHGPPRGKIEVRCGVDWVAVEVWGYDGSDQVDFPFVLVFLKATPTREARIWRPSVGFAQEPTLVRARSCANGQRLAPILQSIAGDTSDYERTLRGVLTRPRPQSEEWVAAFAAQSTDMPSGAVPLPATLDVAYPGRHQQRTVVHGVLRVPAAATGVGDHAGYRSHDFLLTGEVLHDGALFETFRYKFDVPAEDAPAALPLAFERLLRPGTYRMVLRLDDLNGEGVYRGEQELAVPAEDAPVQVSSFEDPETARLFEEATEALARGETSIRIVPPRGELLTGFVRFDTLVSGPEIERVRFLLDDRPVVTRNRPPYNVEIDLGPLPAARRLRAEALDPAGQEVSSDELLVNAGGSRFAIALREPRPGRHYERSLEVRAEVIVPEGRTLDRVEIFLGDRPVATLYQEPFVQPIALPPGGGVEYVRAVAYLPDGTQTESIVFVNAPGPVEQVEVQMVELYTTVLDRAGRPIDGLGQEAFRVREDGTPQKIARFERVEGLPIHVGVLIDNSASMYGVLDEVRAAALSFFQQAVRPKDQAALVTFNRFPRLAVELTSDPTALGRGLAGLVAEGQTALYDSVMFALYYFSGVEGQRALLILSDGKDESSRFSFDETLEYARRAGITLYTIGLRLDASEARGKLSVLADETGGRSFFVNDVTDLPAVYAGIQQELRSQYLVAYQSSNPTSDGRFRIVELDVDRPGAEAKTIHGYYP